MTSIGRFQRPGSMPSPKDMARRSADTGDFANHLATADVPGAQPFIEVRHGGAHPTAGMPPISVGQSWKKSTARQPETQPQGGMAPEPGVAVDQAHVPGAGGHPRRPGLPSSMGVGNGLQGVPNQARSNERRAEPVAAHDHVGKAAALPQSRDLRDLTEMVQGAGRSPGRIANPESATDRLPDLQGAGRQPFASFGEMCAAPDLPDIPVPTAVLPAASHSLAGVDGSAQAGRISWSRVFSQHWLANGYLSLVQVVAADAITPAAARPAAVASPSPSLPTQNEAITALGVGTPVDGGILPPWLASNRGVPKPDTDAPDIAKRLSHALGPIVAADRSWPERLLRLSGREQGAATVWLRDYSLQPADMERTIGALRREAAKENIEIGRIVVNGHTVWQSGSRQGSE